MLKMTGVLAFVLGSMLCACGGGGGGGGGGSTATEGLTTPSELQVVTPVEEAAPPGSTLPGAAADDFPAGCDYLEDEASVYVYDSALEPLNTINMILNYMGQTAASELINEGYYNALIDPTLAEVGMDSSNSESGQSSSSDAVEYQWWVVGSTRSSDTSPQTIQAWVPDDDPDDDWNQIIRVEAAVSEGVSDENPFGQFELNFAGIDPETGSWNDPMMYGVLETNDLGGGDPGGGHIGFSFFENQGDIDEIPSPGDESRRVQVNVQMSADETEGEAKILTQMRYDWGEGDSGLITEEYLVAFDEEYFLRQTDGGDDTSFSRSEYDEMVWRYILYHADGEDVGNRVELNSGFGFRTEEGEYGYMGYWGMWLPDGVEVWDGDTVIRDVYGEINEDQEYTVQLSRGKLIKYEKNSVDVADVEDDPFRWWFWDEEIEEGQEFIIVYRGGVWAKTFEIDGETHEYTPIDPPLVIDTEALGYLNMWSDHLGGPAAWVHDDPLFVTYYQQSLVNDDSDLFVGSSQSTVLYGYMDCLRSGLTGEEVEAGDIFLEEAPDVATPHIYVFLRNYLQLYHDPTGTGFPLNRVGLAGGEAPEEGPYLWGMQSGPLVTDPSGFSSIYDLWNAEEFYVYETGHNPWNWYVGLINVIGQTVVFDPPIQFTYTHFTANDRGGDDSHDGKTFFLEYGGPGDLWGLPQEGADLNDDGNDDRWYPIVNLADGVLLGPTGTEYVMRAYEIEQSLREDPAGLLVLDVVDASDLVLPDGSNYSTPNIGDKPVVTDPPRVIAGEVAEDGAEE
jgi:hypothetical protein